MQKRKLNNMHTNVKKIVLMSKNMHANAKQIENAPNIKDLDDEDED